MASLYDQLFSGKTTNLPPLMSKFFEKLGGDRRFYFVILLFLFYIFLPRKRI